MTTQRRTARNPGMVAARPTTWAQQVTQPTLTAVASRQLFDLTHPDLVSSDLGGTCMRMILQIHASTLGTVPEIEGLACGVIRISNDAFLAGPAAVPAPMTDLTQDWYYWWGGFPPLFNEATQVVAVDIRSARRLRGGDRLVLIMENPVNELAIELSIMRRTLWKPV